MASGNGWRVTRAGIGFVIVLIVLGLLVFAVVSYVQQRGEQARREEAAKIAQENLDSQSEQPVIADDGQSEEENPPQQSGSNSNTNTNTDEDTPDELSTTGKPVTPDVMPETGIGPAEIIAVVALTASTAYFIASRRAVRGY